MRSLVFLLALSGLSCSKGAAPTRDVGTGTDDSGLPSVQVGDRAVVEHAIATFVEGTVVAVARDRARVQVSHSTETIEQSLVDLYLPCVTDEPATLPKASSRGRGDGARVADSTLREGNYAVCRMDDGRWRGCRIESIATLVKVVDDDATSAEISWRNVLAPTPVTELNVRQRFERNAKRRAFREGAKSAGKPRLPGGWRPTLNAKVLAERDGGWMSAEVKGSKKGFVRIQWDADHRTTDTTESELSPEPPIDFVPTVGVYVLARPSSGARTWTVMRVETAGTTELGLSNEAGDRSQMATRDVVPLERRSR